ncbi:hypothetical protein BH11PSE4_BH11PSE4_34420 [soil metagenome]
MLATGTILFAIGGYILKDAWDATKIAAPKTAKVEAAIVKAYQHPVSQQDLIIQSELWHTVATEWLTSFGRFLSEAKGVLANYNKTKGFELEATNAMQQHYIDFREAGRELSSKAQRFPDIVTAMKEPSDNLSYALEFLKPIYYQEQLGQDPPDGGMEMPAWLQHLAGTLRAKVESRQAWMVATRDLAERRRKDILRQIS